jgi:hypothetical protein
MMDVEVCVEIKVIMLVKRGCPLSRIGEESSKVWGASLSQNVKPLPHG